MTNDDDFISNEKILKKTTVFNDLLSFFKYFTFLKKMLIFIILIQFTASFTPQIILKIIGEHAKCENEQNCIISLFNLFNIHISIISIWFSFIILLISQALSWILFEVIGIWEITYLHKKIVQIISKTRITWFDENPSDRILNRILNDFYNLRDLLVRLSDVSLGTMTFIAIAFSSSWTNSYVLFLFPLCWLIIIYITREVSIIGANIKERTSISRGLFLSNITDIIDGSYIYSLYNKEHIVISKVYNYALNYSRINLLAKYIYNWGFSYSSLVLQLFVGVLFSVTVWGLSKNTVNIVEAGIIFSVIFQTFSFYGYLIWSYGEVGKETVNIKRVLNLTTLPNEIIEEREHYVGQDIKNILLGDICFKNYTMQYKKNSPIILNNLNLIIKQNKHIAIIGRTGAGKSSLFQALMRLVYVKQGDITIGNKSIFDYDINEYRKVFAIIPQNPWLFKASLKENLDPANIYNDENILLVLNKVGLYNLLLTMKIEENGKNLSQGERQLLCLARALLDKKEIILMDEPTSSLDNITNDKIINIIKNEFKNKTIIMIAHRYETIKNFDVIIDITKINNSI